MKEMDWQLSPPTSSESIRWILMIALKKKRIYRGDRRNIEYSWNYRERNETKLRLEMWDNFFNRMDFSE